MKDAGDVRSESLQPIDLGQVIQQPLDVGGHGRGLRHMRPRGVEASLISVILNIDLLSLWSDETVAAANSIWCTNLLSGGSIIVGEAAKMKR